MSDTYSIRIRGRVQGPFEIAKIQELVHKGQVGRMHEVSADGHTWVAASSVPELFQAVLNKSNAAVPPVATAVNEFAPGNAAGNREVKAPLVSQDWYYSVGGGSEGPHSFAELQSLAASGRFQSYDNVWDPNKSAWIEAATIHGLDTQVAMAPQQMGVAAVITQPATESFASEKIGWALKSASGWLLFLSIWFLLVGILIVIGALIGLSTSEIEGITRPMGITTLIMGSLITFFGGLLLSAYTKASAASAQPTENACLLAIQAQNRFWFFLSLLLMVMTVIVTAAAIFSAYAIR